MKKAYLYLAILLVFTSCETVVELDLVEGKKNLVSQSVIEFAQGEEFGVATVTLTETAAFFSEDPNPVVSGALVVVNDIYTLDEVGATGVYVNQSIPLTNDLEFKLSIEAEINDLQGSWEGTDVFTPLATIDTFYVDFQPSQHPQGRDGYYINIGFEEPGNEVNFYLQELDEILADEEAMEKRGFGMKFWIYDDLVVNGNYIEFPINDRPYMIGDTVDFKFSSISEPSYLFYENLFQLTFQTIGTGAAPPFPLRGNLVSQNENFDNALGNFKVKHMFHKTLVIGEE